MAGAGLILDKPLANAEMLRDLEERMVKLVQGTGAGSGCSELGCDISTQLG